MSGRYQFTAAGSIVQVNTPEATIVQVISDAPIVHILDDDDCACRIGDTKRVLIGDLEIQLVAQYRRLTDGVMIWDMTGTDRKRDAMVPT